MSSLLLVEDDEAIGQLVKQYLEEKGGWQVLWLRNGEDALVELKRHPVRFVVLDIGLPGIDGFEVCREIRAESNVPIVMLTARDEELDRVVGLEIGADDYVAKPFSPRELAARIRAILRRAEPTSHDDVLTARGHRAAADVAHRDGGRRSGRDDHEGVRAARVLHRAPRDRPVARAPARRRLGDVLSGRHAHRRPARRTAAAEARRRRARSAPSAERDTSSTA